MPNHITPPATIEDLRERYIGQQFYSIEERLEAGDKRMAALESELKAARDELARNSEITQEIRDILAAVRLGLRVLGGIGQLVKWLGALAAAVAAIYGAWQAITKGLQFPSKG